MNVVRPNQGSSRRRTIAAAVGLAVPLGFGGLDPGNLGFDGAAWAQSSALSLRPSQSSKPAAKLDVLQQHDKDLAAIRAEQLEATEAQAKLRLEIENIGTDRRKLNQQLIATAARVRAAEAGIADTEERLKPLSEHEQSIRKSLDSRRAVIAEVLAALQRIGRRPPPALLVRPDDALEALRSAMLLGAVLPGMRNEVVTLAGDLADLVRVRKDIAEQRDRQQRELSALADERQRLTLLTEQRQKQLTETEAAFSEARKRAAALASNAENLKDLIAKLEQGLDSATRNARMAARTKDESGAGGSADTARLQPAVAFASARGILPLPVNGVRIREYGATDGVGGVEKGLSIATRSRAQVTSPCDGWVVYAGPFRSYGQLLILNAGGGYHVLLAGMERVSVDIGQFVLTGEPVAMMGSGSKVAAILTVGSSQPILYVEFRKDGTPIDPSPWWAISEGEKARG